jgi:hypothetical protein
MRINHPTLASHLIPTCTVLGSLVLLSILILQGCQKTISHKEGVDMELVADNFVSPIQIASVPHSERLYIVDQIGKIWVIDKDDYKRPTPFLDISSKLVTLNPDYDERGL